MMEYKYRLLLVLAIVSGVYLSAIYINPHGGVITLSEMILQLSGSRGSFVLGFSYSELASFVMRLFPTFLFELYAGIMLYQHFCTASIYVFSRYPYRMKWYISEVCQLGGKVCIFNMVLLVSAIFISSGRYEVQINYAGMVLVFYHFFIHSLWVYIMALSVNLLAIYLGSSNTFVLVISSQLVGTVLLNLIDLLVRYFDNRLSYKVFLIWNPIAHLVLGWHNSNMEMVNKVLVSPYMQTDLNNSLIMFALFGIIVTLIGSVIIKNHDLLVSDLETEVS